MLYLTDGNEKIITSYTVYGHMYDIGAYNIIHLTLTTDKGNIAFELCCDSNTDSATAMNAIIQATSSDIAFSLYSERKYMFISSVDSISGDTIDSSLICKVTGCMIQPT